MVLSPPFHILHIASLANFVLEGSTGPSKFMALAITSPLYRLLKAFHDRLALAQHLFAQDSASPDSLNQCEAHREGNSRYESLGV